MDINFEKKVREKAYEIWVAAGMEDGAANAHWLEAEQSVMNETVQPTKKASARKPAAKPATPKTVAAKKSTAKAPKSKQLKH